MHAISIDQDIRARLIAMRGSHRSLLDSIDPKRAAHLIIDMQNGFTLPGAIVEIPVAREIIPAINAISRAVRDAGGLNVFVQFLATEESSKGWTTWFDRFIPADRRDGMLETFGPDRPGYALHAELDVAPSDITVSKTRFGAFVQGTSELHDRLRERGIDTLIITGTATNVCCESTARDAMQLDYKVIVVADATAALTDAEHNHALDGLACYFSDIVSTEEVVDTLSA